MMFIVSFLVGLLVSLAILSVSLVVMSRSDSGLGQQMSFESGMVSLEVDKKQLSTRFFILSLVFLMLDLEVAYIILVPLSMSSFSIIIISGLIYMIWMYYLGTVYEWWVGSLTWFE